MGEAVMKLDIITPVGPGHEELVHRAAGSIQIAKEHSVGLFEDIDLIAIDDTKGQLGRSQARNLAVADSKADWIFFLDADDLMHPEAFKNLSLFFDDMRDADAVWGKIVEYKEGNLLERYQVPEITSLQSLIKNDPYLTLQMGHFVKTDVAKEHPFKEDMNTGEDWEYYLRLWKKHNCIKIDAPFMCNVRGEHSTGPRSANGAQWREVVEKLIGDA
jgi:hypothetical protein